MQLIRQTAYVESLFENDLGIVSSAGGGSQEQRERRLLAPFCSFVKPWFEAHPYISNDTTETV
jgi:hypothetical protein